jgi:hypothetical protein
MKIARSIVELKFGNRRMELYRGEFSFPRLRDSLGVSRRTEIACDTIVSGIDRRSATFVSQLHLYRLLKAETSSSYSILSHWVPKLHNYP